MGRLLGADAFGRLGFIQATVATFGIFAGLRLGLTATRFLAESREQEPEKAGRLIGLVWSARLRSGCSCRPRVVLRYPVVLKATTGVDGLVREVRIAAVLLILNSMIGVQTGILSGFEAFRRMAGINLLRGLCSVPVASVATSLWALNGALWGLIAGAAVTVVLNSIAINRECREAGIRPRYSGAYREWPVLWTFSLPALLSGAMIAPVTWMAASALVRLPGGFEQMGLFNAANTFRMAILFLPATIGQACVPILSNLYGLKDWGNYSRLLFLNLGIATGVGACGVAVVFAVTSPWIMAAYGAEYRVGWPILVLLAASALLERSGRSHSPPGHCVIRPDVVGLPAQLPLGGGAGFHRHSGGPTVGRLRFSGCVSFRLRDPRRRRGAVRLRVARPPHGGSTPERG